MTVFFDRARSRWRYDFRSHGTRYTGYCRDATGAGVASKSAAKQAEGVARRRVAIAPRLPDARELTLAQVMAALAATYERQADYRNKQRYIRELLAYFGPARAMAAIDAPAIQDYIAWSLAQPVQVWTGGPNKRESARRQTTRAIARTRGPATANLYLHVLRQALKRAAATRDPLTHAPALAHVPAVPILKVPKRRARPVPEDVIPELFALLPAHLHGAVMLSLYFGFRQGEVFALTLAQIDWHGRGIRLKAEAVKGAEDAFLPAGQAAMDLLRELADTARARGLRHLVSYQPRGKDAPWRPMKSPKRAWSTAMKQIAERFGARWRWHDLRAAFITYVALHSGPLPAQQLGRHKDFKTTRGYIDVADDVRRAAAESAGRRPALTLIAAGREISHTRCSSRDEDIGDDAPQAVDIVTRPRSSAG